MNELSMLVANVFAEALGYDGVEMYNDKYPSSQNNGPFDMISSIRCGNSVINQGGTDTSTYARHGNNSVIDNKTYGDLVLDAIKSKNPGFQQEYTTTNQAKNGDSILMTYRNK